MRIILAAAAVALIWQSPVRAQESGSDGRTLYPAAYFAQYSPSNALEIVERVPGFTLEIVDEEVRGFGQAAGNVVINGARPSSKSDTLETILARIPASQVARVEVGPGDLFGSEFSGKPQVLNLVLASGAALAGTITAIVRRDFSGQVRPEGNVSALLRRGRSSFNVSAGLTNSHTPEEGYDLLTSLPSGDLKERRRKYNDVENMESFLSGSWAHDAGAYRTAHVNFRAAKGRFDLEQSNDVFPTGGTIRDDRLRQDYRTKDFELGGDVTRPLGGGGLKLIGLATRLNRDNLDTSFNRVQGEVIGGFIQTTDSQRNETLLRVVWNHANIAGWNVELGVEGVHNSLDSDVNLFLIDDAGGQTRIDLPVDQARVSEKRGEAFVNAGRPLSEHLRMDLGLVYEASRLTVTGDTEAERVLHFLKPKAVFDWSKNKWHAQLSLSRTVAQLNFEDFISSAELANDRVDAGNADLVPQRAWEALLMVERPILGDGLAKVELGYNHISLLQDRIPTPEGFDAPGNIGTGRQKFAKGTIAAPLGRFGIKGGRLDLTGMIQDLSVRDPYTHENRRFSGVGLWSFQGSFRQDLNKFAWGFTVYTNPAQVYYRRNETDELNGEEPFVEVFAEYRPNASTTVTFGLDNIFQVEGERFRTFFAPTRANLEPYEYEVRSRSGHIVTYLSLKKSFG